MRVFLSADIEGITTTNLNDECNPNSPLYKAHAEQMTKEVLAACEGAFAAGAKEIFVKDAHGSACNIDTTKMPSGVTLLRNWTGHPYLMVEGVNNTFDAAMFVGYHSPAGKAGNPLSHTISGRHVYIKINGRHASEFMIYSYACALEGVPTVLLCGDKMLCDDDKNLHPNLITVPVKDGLGALTINRSTTDTLREIKDSAEKALKQDLSSAKISLPNHFEVEIFFKDQAWCEKVSHFPGVKKLSGNIVAFENDNYYEILRTIKWLV